jgi:hypothetical protein
MKEAFMYVGAFFLTWIFGTITRMIQAINGKTHYPLVVLMAFFFPLQGFFNFLIYMRPIQNWQKKRKIAHRNRQRLQQQQQHPNTYVQSQSSQKQSNLSSIYSHHGGGGGEDDEQAKNEGCFGCLSSFFSPRLHHHHQGSTNVAVSGASMNMESNTENNNNNNSTGQQAQNQLDEASTQRPRSRSPPRTRLPKQTQKRAHFNVLDSTSSDVSISVRTVSLYDHFNPGESIMGPGRQPSVAVTSVAEPSRQQDSVVFGSMINNPSGSSTAQQRDEQFEMSSIYAGTDDDHDQRRLKKRRNKILRLLQQNICSDEASTVKKALKKLLRYESEMDRHDWACTIMDCSGGIAAIVGAMKTFLPETGANGTTTSNRIAFLGCQLLQFLLLADKDRVLSSLLSLPKKDTISDVLFTIMMSPYHNHFRSVATYQFCRYLQSQLLFCNTAQHHKA